jgi:ATP-dependent DNA ligase
MSYDENWVAEVKKNGDRLVLVKDSGRFTFWNRQKTMLKYVPPDEMTEELHKLAIPNGTQLDAELLHNHTKNIKNQIYFYDVYTWNDKPVETDFKSRRLMLEINIPLAGKHICLATQFQGEDFKTLFDNVIKAEENEGLVMKNLTGFIVFNTFKSPDVPWQIKIRRESKNSKF